MKRDGEAYRLEGRGIEVDRRRKGGFRYRVSSILIYSIQLAKKAFLYSTTRVCPIIFTYSHYSPIESDRSSILMLTIPSLQNESLPPVKKVSVFRKGGYLDMTNPVFRALHYPEITPFWLYCTARSLPFCHFL